MKPRVKNGIVTNKKVHVVSIISCPERVGHAHSTSIAQSSQKAVTWIINAKIVNNFTQRGQSFLD